MRTLLIPENTDEARFIFKSGLWRDEYVLRRCLSVSGKKVFLNEFIRDIVDNRPSTPLTWSLDRILLENEGITKSTSCQWSETFRTKSGYKMYPYIPLDFIYFYITLRDGFNFIDKNSPIRFVDCGSGGGDKVILAELVLDSFWNNGEEYLNSYEGIELNESYVNMRITERVRFGDITKEDYSKYNMIYAYNPMDDTRGMQKFFVRVAKTAKSGTVCMFVNVHSGREAIEKKDVRSMFLCTGAENIYIVK